MLCSRCSLLLACAVILLPTTDAFVGRAELLNLLYFLRDFLCLLVPSACDTHATARPTRSPVLSTVSRPPFLSPFPPPVQSPVSPPTKKPRTRKPTTTRTPSSLSSSLVFWFNKTTDVSFSRSSVRSRAHLFSQ
jgi:hypothetical protein